LLLDDVLCLLLRAHEQHGAALAAETVDEVEGLLQAVEGHLQVDDVDSGSLPVQEAGHLRVPAPGLVPEMHSRFEELTPRRDGHVVPLLLVVSSAGSPRPGPGALLAGRPGPP